MIKITGIVEITEKLKDLANSQSMEKAMQKACALVEADAKKKAPKDTGALRRSISSRVETETGSIRGIVFTPLEYAPYIEYGTGLFAEKGGRQDVPWNYQDDKDEWHSTSGLKPQPYLRPALDENREDIIEMLRGGLLND